MKNFVGFPWENFGESSPLESLHYHITFFTMLHQIFICFYPLVFRLFLNILVRLYCIPTVSHCEDYQLYPLDNSFINGMVSY